MQPVQPPLSLVMLLNDRSSRARVLEYQSGGMVDWFRWFPETLKDREEMKPAGGQGVQASKGEGEG